MNKKEAYFFYKQQFFKVFIYISKFSTYFFVNFYYYFNNFFESKNINKLDWPGNSPDTNPIENLFGIITKQVYSNGKIYFSKEKLLMAIEDAINNVSSKTLRSLAESMTNRLIEAVRNDEANTKY